MTRLEDREGRASAEPPDVAASTSLGPRAEEVRSWLLRLTTHRFVRLIPGPIGQFAPHGARELRRAAIGEIRAMALDAAATMHHDGRLTTSQAIGSCGA